MNAVLTMMRKEVRENLRDHRTIGSALLFGALFVPAMFALMISLVVRHGDTVNDRPVELAVAHAARAPNLISFLEQSDLLLARVEYDDGAARSAVQHQSHRIVLAIPPDYGARLAAGQPAPLQLYSDSSDPSNLREVARVRSVLAQYNARIVQMRQLARGIDPLSMVAIALQDVDVATPSSRSVLVLGTMSYMILLTMLMGGMYLAIDATAGERERGSLEPLLTLPVARSALIYGKMLATCAFMALSLILCVLSLSLVLRHSSLASVGMRVNFGPSVILGLIGSCLPFAPVGAALMTIVAAYTRSYREAQTYTSLLMIVPVLPLVYSGTMGLRPNAALMLIPSMGQHFLIIGLLRAEPLPPLYVALSVGATLLIGAILAFIAGRLYDRERLLG
jgi:sodium transport system permease protein